MAKRKLEPRQVILMRQMRREGFKRKFLSQLFKISEHNVYQVVKYMTYKDVR